MRLFEINENMNNYTYVSFLRNSNRGISSFIQEKDSGISLHNAFWLSTFAHPLFAGMLWLSVKLILLLLLLLGISLPLFNKPEPKVKDIEFVLTSNMKEISPVKKMQINRKSNTVKPMPSSKPDKSSFIGDIGGLKSRIKSRNENSVVNRNPVKLTSRPHSETVVRMSANRHKGFHMPKTLEPDAFTIPMPKIKPVSNDVGFGTDGTPGYSSPSASTASLIASGSGSGGSGESNIAGRGKRRSGGYSLGNGGIGDPRLGKSSNFSDNILKEPDMSSYVTELQRRVKRNWAPPKGNDNEKVSLFLRIGKDGKLLVLNIKNISGNPDADNAAVYAVRQASPFRPLPSEYRVNYLDVILTFDYNMFSLGSKY